MLRKNWPDWWKSCAITHENGPKQTFSRKRTCEPFWPGDLLRVVLCIKLWSVRGGGTVRMMKLIILASMWATNSPLQRHLNGPKRPQTCTLRSKNHWKSRQISSTRGLCTSWMLQKNWPEWWKSCAITLENDSKRMFSWKRTCEPFWLGDLPLAVLCINNGPYVEEGPLKSTKCNILTSVWGTKSRLQRQLNGPKKARNVYHTVQKSTNTSPNVFYK
jgi:hypothetical protein